MELHAYFEPQQLACSEAGAAKLVFSVRATIEMNRMFVAVKLDLKNAFNECFRAAIVESLESEPT